MWVIYVFYIYAGDKLDCDDAMRGVWSSLAALGMGLQGFWAMSKF